jgi:hypothetical protein
MNLNQEIEDDILEDASKLFILDENEEYSGNNDSLELYNHHENNNISNEPETTPLQESKPEIDLFTAPLVKQQPEKQKESEDDPVVKDKIPEATKPKPLAKPAIEQPTTTKEKKPTKEVVNNNKDDNNKTKNKNYKCKNDSDCDSNSFCVIKTGKCASKLKLNQFGCSSNDQCSDPIAVCHSQTCMLSCKVGNDAMCKVEGQACVAVKDLKLFQPFRGKFNGVCDKIKSREAPLTNKSSTTKASMSNSSIALISGSAVIILTLIIFCLIYLRAYLKRRNRNDNPDMFLFNKLQRHASPSLPMAQRSNSAERLNMRLSSMGGARFTRWAALSKENDG